MPTVVFKELRFDRHNSRLLRLPAVDGAQDRFQFRPHCFHMGRNNDRKIISEREVPLVEQRVVKHEQAQAIGRGYARLVPATSSSFTLLGDV